MKINVLICAYKSGDVLPYTLQQFQEFEQITRIVVGDGPHTGPIKPGAKHESPTVKEICEKFSKVKYEYTDWFPTRSDKNNYMIEKYIEKDCDWILNVDSDEVYHENDLKKLVEFLKNNPPYERYSIKTINPYPDFYHEFRVEDWKPRLYKYYPDVKCPPNHCRFHQYVLSDKQKKFEGTLNGMANLNSEICQIYHLNAIRFKKEGEPNRIKILKNGEIIHTSGKIKTQSKIYDLDKKYIPKSILELKKEKL